MTVVIEARKRDLVGKKSSKKLRQKGLVPGVFYEKGKPAVHLVFDKKALQYFMSHAHGLVDIKIEGKKEPLKCVLKDVQYHPVTDEVIHVDFQGVTMGEKISVTVPLVLRGTPQGVKEGGLLEHMIRELEIECLPKHLPEQLEIDVSNLKIGDALHVKDLSFENIRILDDPNEVILVIEAPRVEEVVEEAAATFEEETPEPEVITSKKEEKEEGE
ncbi:MAG: 50S ribosomal protein L25 [Calditrichaeota bacterium]|nr:50S ribosomal protein L25 [Calditrichota bacterium]